MGIHSSGDIISTATLVSQLADGLDLDTLFEDYADRSASPQIRRVKW